MQPEERNKNASRCNTGPGGNRHVCKPIATLSVTKKEKRIIHFIFLGGSSFYQVKKSVHVCIQILYMA